MNTGGSNFDKTWFQRSLNEGAIQRAYEAMQVLGRALPCSVVSVSGSIVTVAFQVASLPFVLPQVTIPKAESQWIRVPTQPGDLGIAVPAETLIGGIDGLGSGTADLSLRGNLSNLYFLPIASVIFPAIPDINQAFVSGKDGVLIEDESAASVINLTPTQISVVAPTQISLTAGGHSIVINSSGVTIDGRVFLSHEHSGVMPGGGVTGPPV